MTNNLATPFHKIASESPHRTALVLENHAYAYGELSELVRPMARWISRAPAERQRRVGILASRNLEAYTGLLASLWAGAMYVPLNPKAPYEYLRRLINFSDLDLLIVGDAQLGLLTDAFFKEHHLPILAPYTDPSALLGTPIQGRDALAALEPLDEPVSVASDAFAHLMFTSGTTGEPKGIAATVSNATHYFEAVYSRYNFTPDDRFSQNYSLDFEPIIFDLLVPWGIGASAHVIPEQQQIAPAHFIRDHRLTVWYSLPYHIDFMARMGLLKPGEFPSLRLSLFVGEPLTSHLAELWQQAAPNSIVENGYAPSEVCGLCLGQYFEPSPECLTPDRSYVALGTPYPLMKVDIVSNDGEFLPSNTVGEIAISGPQVTPGYLNNPEMTKQKFRDLDHPLLGRCTWYLTGDQGYMDASGRFHFLGRLDHQVKILGYRIELEKIEFHLREASGSDEVAALAWPIVEGLAQGLVGFVGGIGHNPAMIKTAMKKSLPKFMVPQQIFCLESLPRSKNGKIDRKKLISILNQR